MKKLHSAFSISLGIGIAIYLLTDYSSLLTPSKLISYYGLDTFELSDLRHFPKAFMATVLLATFCFIYYGISKEMKRPIRGFLDFAILGISFIFCALIPAVQDGSHDILPFLLATVAICVGIDLLSLYPLTPVIGIPITVISFVYILLEMPRALSLR